MTSRRDGPAVGRVLLALVATLLLAVRLPAASKDVTAKVEDLGAAVGEKLLGGDEKKLYARSVHDMAFYNGRLYLASGCATTNTGPTPVYFYDLRAEEFGFEHTIPEEQIGVFRIFAKRLWIPGIDPVPSEGLVSRVYMLKGDKLHRMRVPNEEEGQGGNHLFDIVAYRQKLFVALQRWQGEVLVSEDEGKTWRSFGRAVDHIRTVSFFECGGELYLTGYAGRILRYDGDSFVKTPYDTWGGGSPGKGINARSLPKRYDWVQEPSYAAQPVNLNEDTVLYIARGRNRMKHSAGLALFRVEKDGDGLSVTHCELPVLAEDVTVADGIAYVVGNARLEGDAAHEKARYGIAVFGSRDGKKFVPLFHLRSPARASSLAVVKGDVYLGLGCTYNDPHPAAGHLVRVPKSSYR